MKILVATHNPGKLHEYAELLSDLDIFDEKIQWVSLSDVGIALDVEETGTTFAENALLKAKTYAEVSGLFTLADDSGLVVDALSGAPGIYSARYGSPDAVTDEDRYQKLLSELSDVPDDERSARFKCVVAFCMSDGVNLTAEGACEGRIIHDPRGENGFGYDPVFFVTGYEKTMAELPPETKNKISHRAAALENMKPKLRDLFAENQ